MRRIFFGIIMSAFLIIGIGSLIIFKNYSDTLTLQHDTGASGYAGSVPEIDEDYLHFYGLDDFETTLPVLYINTDNEMINGENNVWTSISILNSENDGKLHSITEKSDLTIPAKVKYRGASSRNFEKKQFKAEFYKKKGKNGTYDYDLFGMGAASEWVLNGPFLDKTLMRNYLVYNLAAEMMEWAPDCRFVELFCDGKYQGVYLVVEPVSNGPGRLRLSTFGLLFGESPYILSRDREGTDYRPLQNYGKINGLTSNNLYIDYPAGKKLSDNAILWITADISEFERVLYSKKYNAPGSGYENYINVDNFVDYVIINEFALNHDAGFLSTYAYKELGGKLNMAVWDYNNSFDNYQWFSVEKDRYYITETPWFERLLKDPAFVKRVTERYHELRKTTLSNEHIEELLNTGRTELGDAVDRNFKIWDYTFHINLLTDDVNTKRDIASYSDALDQLKSTITERLEFMDGHIQDIQL